MTVRLKAALICHMNFVPLRWEKLDLSPSVPDKRALNAVELSVCVCVCVRLMSSVQRSTDMLNWIKSEHLTIIRSSQADCNQITLNIKLLSTVLE